ncbi:MAG: hypothetical protein V2I43_25300 [Parvularcula sp.]|jgi:hypothetical protein|nr:hypothetical protein [Parvularcula sp.]
MTTRKDPAGNTYQTTRPGAPSCGSPVTVNTPNGPVPGRITAGGYATPDS